MQSACRRCHTYNDRIPEHIAFPQAPLLSQGKNLYLATQASGDAIVGTPGENGLGTLLSGFVEQSNVSVVEEMVNMIASERTRPAPR